MPYDLPVRHYHHFTASANPMTLEGCRLQLQRCLDACQVVVAMSDSVVFQDKLGGERRVAVERNRYGDALPLGDKCRRCNSAVGGKELSHRTEAIHDRASPFLARAHYGPIIPVVARTPETRFCGSM